MSDAQPQSGSSTDDFTASGRPLRIFRVAREGLPFIAIGWLVVLVLLAVGWYAAAGVFTAVAVFVTAFFRDPDRRAPADEDLLLSPADGTVTVVEEDDNGLRISVFLSVFNVHVNRSPYAGVVRQVKYHPGRFIAANLDKSSEENERNSMLVETPRGPISVVQIAGLIARRIVCRVQSGDELGTGERFGLIRFGSRTDLIVPGGAEPLVHPGAKVRGGSTPLARWREGGDG